MQSPLAVPVDGGVAFEDGPDRGRILVFGRDTGGRYSLMEWTVAAAEKLSPEATRNFGPHRHHEIEETFFVQRGELEFLLDETVIVLRTGDFVRVPPGVRHGYANASGADVHLLVSFHPGGFEELFLKYRTDRPGGPEGEGFVADAIRFHASEFEGD